MKSLFSRFKSNNNNSNHSASSTSRPSSTGSRQDTSSSSASRPGERKPSDSSLEPPRPATPLASHSPSSSSSESTRPHSTVDAPLELEPAVWEETHALEMHGRRRTVSGAEAVKKVTFKSPAPTPTTSVVLDDIHPLTSDDARGRTASTSILQPTRSSSSSPVKQSQNQHPRPVPVLSSRPNSRSSFLHNPLTMRKSSLPSPSGVSPTKSALSPTPSEGSAVDSSRSYLPPPNSWSEMAEEELIANLAPKERTRQEVLWEIVSSEERYVAELIKLNDTFSRALLPPSASSPSLHLFDSSNTLSRTLSPSGFSSPTSPTDSFDHLPIAAQYSKASHESSPVLDSTNANVPPGTNARMTAYNILTHGRPAEGGVSTANKKSSMTTLSGKARSHQSLPPLPRNSSQAGSYLSGKSNRMSFQPGRRNDSRVASAASLTSLAAKDVQLPEDLEKVLTVLSGGILEGHLKLAAALRKRYENQYPLVRSLADVFNTHAYLFKEYSAYVLHLERALDTIDHALNLALTKRSSRASSDSPMMRLGRVLLSLEEVAAERGESGLSISLAKPFQRLLKYPLLFQNLLFNTDPSLKEYEATLGMVDQVEEIVRSIEDEKSSSEERERTRDVWARIEGLENDKVLMTPKADRLLVSETQVPSIEGQKRDDGTKKKSLKRLSDILKGPIDADLWIVRFSDVSLLCLRIGVTHLPISGTKGKVPKSESANDLGGRRGHGARRVQSIRARNLYRFVKVQEWNLKQKVGNSEGLVSMEDISRARSRPSIEIPARSRPSTDMPTIDEPDETPRKLATVPLKTNDGPTPSKDDSSRLRRDADTETIVSDHLSVMSFAFKGSDQVRPIRVRPKTSPTKPVAGTTAHSRTSRPISGIQRRSSAGHVAGHAANAKFAHRLRPTEVEQNTGDATVRPSSKSRARQSLPPAMAARPFPGLSNADRNANTASPNSPRTKSTLNAPNKTSTTPGTTTSTASVKGTINTTATTASVAGRRKIIMQRNGVSASPSEDSGVAGLWMAYRDADGTGTGTGTPVRRGVHGVGAGKGGRL